jgi:hypothetical protein
MSERDATGPAVTPVEPAAEALADEGVLGADDPADDAPTGIPPIPGPPPGVPDEDWPDGGHPPVNLGVMDPG